MKKVLAAMAITALAAVAAVPALAGTKTIKVGDDYFVRKGKTPTVTISKGSSLKFVWRGNSPHNVVKRRGPGKRFNSGVKVSGSWKHKFRRAGSYKIYCTIHTGMNLNVRVR